MAAGSDTSPARARALLPVRAMYMGYYMAIGSYIPFINLYYERIGLSGVQIGTLAALPVLVSSTTTVIWGSIADTMHWHRQLLRVAMLLAPAAMLLISCAGSYAALIPVVLVYALVTSPIIPLLDSTALEAAEAHSSDYGSLRVWGTIGWSISTWLVGALIQRFAIRAFFYSYIVFILLTFLASWFLQPRQKFMRAPLAHSVRQLLVRTDMLLFLLSVFLLALTSGAVLPFFSLYLDGIGATESAIGLAWTIAAVSEIPVMLFSSGIIRRVRARGLLTVAFATYALRWLLLSFITRPLWALMLQLLHGFSFAAFLVGSVTYVNERTPEGLATTAQAVLSMTTFGLASMAGSLIGGYLYDALGMAALFRVLSLIALLGLAFFWMAKDKPAVVDAAAGYTP